MMKNFLLVLTVCLLMPSSLLSQDAAPVKSDFDKKFRFGLRVVLQPTWFKSTEKSNVPSGAKFGYGFGLNIERRFSETAGLLTGIGADFEGGKYTFRNDPSINYESMYWMDENNDLVTATSENRTKALNTGFVLKERSVKTTYITIPIILKLSTKEINGIKYSGMFGGELGIRINAIAEDSYLQTRKYNDTGYTVVPGVESLSGIKVNKEFSPIPLRFAFNGGLGAEYRLSGSTGVFININYVITLTNQMRSESEYTVYKTESGANNSTPIKQNLKMSAIRISIGVMF
ncbi:outer membrane beta-barrel protein [Aurantibacillus circumpalustris]|uniref:outer membrane beta-barrel protein n=1 Tax=Aurantibacillus circumpalustris TaxID=3036359 RepID=UPI00295BD48B|nr:outer membrane beta-barrel protein [Aurantibacillus circumpalustris]